MFNCMVLDTKQTLRCPAGRAPRLALVSLMLIPASAERGGEYRLFVDLLISASLDDSLWTLLQGQGKVMGHPENKPKPCFPALSSLQISRV